MCRALEHRKFAGTEDIQDRPAWAHETWGQVLGRSRSGPPASMERGVRKSREQQMRAVLYMYTRATEESTTIGTAGVSHYL